MKTECGERQFASRDRMMFLRNERGLGVKNGTLGTIEAVSPGHKRDADKEPGQDRGTNAAAVRLHARMAELGKQVRKDDERDRDRTKDRDRDRGGPGR